MIRTDTDSPAGEPGHLLLPQSDFHDLASGGGSADVIKRLWRAEHSRRLVMLRAFLDAAQADPGLAASPVTPIAEAWAALERAEGQDGPAVAALLMHPQLGAWLSYALRRHRGGAKSSAPGYQDFGQLHAVAIAAATLTGQPYSAVVPLRAGRIIVPQFGMAYFADCPEWDVAEVATENGRIQVRRGDQIIDVPPGAGDRPGWWALRRLTVGDGPALTVWLDDLDPMRDLADPVPPRRLAPADFQRWADLLEDAWLLLVEDHRPMAEALAAGVTSLVPLPAGDGWDTRSASTGDAFGAIMCSPPPDAVTLAVSLAHEFMHIKLGGLMHLFTLTDGPGDPCLYAPWRDDPRPAGGLLQGIYAFFAISDFWRGRLGKTGDVLAGFEYAYARMQTGEALAVALGQGNLTELGRSFADTLGAELRGWTDEVDEQAADLARLVADGHRAGWRIRHCRPARQDVIDLARALDDDVPIRLEIADSQVLPDPEMRHWSAGRLGLARRRLLAPDRHGQARDEDWGAALTDADLALFAGEPAKAAAGFAEEIEHDPESADAWTGLGLALGAGATAPPRAGVALLHRPELVLAVHRETRTAHSPLKVADLVGTLLID